MFTTIDIGVIILVACVKYGRSSVVHFLHERPGKKGGRTMDIIKALEQEQLKTNLPDLQIGDYVKVQVKIKEGNRERLQAFEGTVIAKKGGSLKETFTVRRISYGVGVERIFPIHSPNIDSIEIIRRGKIRRAKLYYLRDRVGKASKVKTRLETK